MFKATPQHHHPTLQGGATCFETFEFFFLTRQHQHKRKHSGRPGGAAPPKSTILLNPLQASKQTEHKHQARPPTRNLKALLNCPTRHAQTLPQPPRPVPPGRRRPPSQSLNYSEFLEKLQTNTPMDAPRRRLGGAALPRNLENSSEQPKKTCAHITTSTPG